MTFNDEEDRYEFTFDTTVNLKGRHLSIQTDHGGSYNDVIGGNGQTSRDDQTDTTQVNGEADSPDDSFGPSTGACGVLGMISLSLLLVGLVGLRRALSRYSRVRRDLM